MARSSATLAERRKHVSPVLNADEHSKHRARGSSVEQLFIKKEKKTHRPRCRRRRPRPPPRRQSAILLGPRTTRWFSSGHRPRSLCPLRYPLGHPPSEPPLTGPSSPSILSIFCCFVVRRRSLSFFFTSTKKTNEDFAGGRQRGRGSCPRSTLRSRSLLCKSRERGEECTSPSAERNCLEKTHTQGGALFFFSFSRSPLFFFSLRKVSKTERETKKKSSHFPPLFAFSPCFFFFSLEEKTVNAGARRLAFLLFLLRTRGQLQ